MFPSIAPTSPLPTRRAGSPPPTSWTAETFTQRTDSKTVRFPIIQHPGRRGDQIGLNGGDWNRSGPPAFPPVTISHTRFVIR
jgi:hypothetical protein